LQWRAETVRNFGEVCEFLTATSPASASPIWGGSARCIALNPHVGGNPATAQEARKAVNEFLQALLKLG